ncbi:hypothetical protein JTB14_000389 [Gonioctena quinquepunctata]|nr:hypothetical protein JTB14_000389 [Gonioctena quinquepunctata]
MEDKEKPPDPPESSLNNNKSKNVYSSSDSGPFEDYVQGNEKNLGNLHILSIAKTIFNLNLKTIIKEFCSKLNRNSPTKVVWDRIRKISGQKASLQLSMPQANVAQEILNSLAPPIFTSSNINSYNGPTSSNFLQ